MRGPTREGEGDLHVFADGDACTLPRALPAGKETVVVTGDKAPSVEACIARVKSLIDVARAAGPPGGGTAHARPAFSRAIQLPPGAEAQVIGVAGATVKAICQVRAEAMGRRLWRTHPFPRAALLP